MPQELALPSAYSRFSCSNRVNHGDPATYPGELDLCMHIIRESETGTPSFGQESMQTTNYVHLFVN